MATTEKTDTRDESTAIPPPPIQTPSEGQAGRQDRHGPQKSNLSIRSEHRPSALSRSVGAFGPFSLMRRLFDDLERLTGFGAPGMHREGRGFEGSMFVPTVEVMHRDHKLIVNVDLPGMSADDIQVTVHDGALVIEGERHSEHEHQEGDVWRCERSYGRFQRVIALPEGTDTTSTEARFENGVLSILLRAPEQQEGRRIEIKTGGVSASRPVSTTSH